MDRPRLSPPPRTGSVNQEDNDRDDSGHQLRHQLRTVVNSAELFYTMICMASSRRALFSDEGDPSGGSDRPESSYPATSAKTRILELRSRQIDHRL